MNVNTEYQLLHRFVRERLRDIHTVKPGVVTKVNDFTVDVKPLTTTKYRDGTQLPLPTLEDVPLMINSGGMGNARITMPIKEGDPVVVLSSDRDYDNLRSSEITKDSIFPGQEINPLSLNPIMAIPCFFTEPQGTPIDKDNVVVENGSTKITVKFDGNVEINTEQSFDVTASQINFNGPVSMSDTLDVSGDTTIGGTMEASVVTDGTIDLALHTHGGVTSGTSSTGPSQPGG